MKPLSFWSPTGRMERRIQGAPADQHLPRRARPAFAEDRLLAKERTCSGSHAERLDVGIPRRDSLEIGFGMGAAGGGELGATPRTTFPR